MSGLDIFVVNYNYIGNDLDIPQKALNNVFYPIFHYQRLSTIALTSVLTPPFSLVRVFYLP